MRDITEAGTDRWIDTQNYKDLAGARQEKAELKGRWAERKGGLGEDTYKMNSYDYARLGAVASDILGIGISAVAGAGNIGAGAAGVASSFADLYADSEDDLDWGDIGSFAVNLGLDIATFIPLVGTAAKFGKATKGLKKVVPLMKAALVAGGAIQGADSLRSFVHKVETDGWDSLSSNDIANAARGIQGLIGGARGIKAGATYRAGTQKTSTNWQSNRAKKRVDLEADLKAKGAEAKEMEATLKTFDKHTDTANSKVGYLKKQLFNAKEHAKKRAFMSDREMRTYDDSIAKMSVKDPTTWTGQAFHNWAVKDLQRMQTQKVGKNFLSKSAERMGGNRQGMFAKSADTSLRPNLNQYSQPAGPGNVTYSVDMANLKPKPKRVRTPKQAPTPVVPAATPTADYSKELKRMNRNEAARLKRQVGPTSWTEAPKIPIGHENFATAATDKANITLSNIAKKANKYKVDSRPSLKPANTKSKAKTAQGKNIKSKATNRYRRDGGKIELLANGGPVKKGADEPSTIWQILGGARATSTGIGTYSAPKMVDGMYQPNLSPSQQKLRKDYGISTTDEVAEIRGYGPGGERIVYFTNGTSMPITDFIKKKNEASLKSREYLFQKETGVTSDAGIKVKGTPYVSTFKPSEDAFSDTVPLNPGLTGETPVYNEKGELVGTEKSNLKNLEQSYRSWNAKKAGLQARAAKQFPGYHVVGWNKDEPIYAGKDKIPRSLLEMGEMFDDIEYDKEYEKKLREGGGSGAKAKNRLDKLNARIAEREKTEKANRLALKIAKDKSDREASALKLKNEIAADKRNFGSRMTAMYAHDTADNLMPKADKPGLTDLVKPNDVAQMALLVAAANREKVNFEEETPPILQKYAVRGLGKEQFDIADRTKGQIAGLQMDTSDPIARKEFLLSKAKQTRQIDENLAARQQQAITQSKDIARQVEAGNIAQQNAYNQRTLQSRNAAIREEAIEKAKSKSTLLQGIGDISNKLQLRYDQKIQDDKMAQTMLAKDNINQRMSQIDSEINRINASTQPNKEYKISQLIKARNNLMDQSTLVNQNILNPKPLYKGDTMKTYTTKIAEADPIKDPITSKVTGKPFTEWNTLWDDQKIEYTAPGKVPELNRKIKAKPLNFASGVENPFKTQTKINLRKRQ